jgi:hypothetical protein
LLIQVANLLSEMCASYFELADYVKAEKYGVEALELFR